MNADVWNISLAHVYLETARSAQRALVLRREGKRLTHNDKAKEHPDFPSLALATTSIALLYSYMAIEAFVNYHVHQQWKAFRAIRHTRLRPPLSPKSFRTLCDALLTAERFIDLKGVKQLKGLPDRLKALITLLGIRQIHNTDRALWARFISMGEYARHFLIHPYPDTAVVQRAVLRIANQNTMRESPDTAASIIRHFYAERHQSPPQWLDTNTVFSIVGIEFPVTRI